MVEVQLYVKSDFDFKLFQSHSFLSDPLLLSQIQFTSKALKQKNRALSPLTLFSFRVIVFVYLSLAFYLNLQQNEQ